MHECPGQEVAQNHSSTFSFNILVARVSNFSLKTIQYAVDNTQNLCHFGHLVDRFTPKIVILIRLCGNPIDLFGDSHVRLVVTVANAPTVLVSSTPSRIQYGPERSHSHRWSFFQEIFCFSP